MQGYYVQQRNRRRLDCIFTDPEKIKRYVNKLFKRNKEKGIKGIGDAFFYSGYKT